MEHQKTLNFNLLNEASNSKFITRKYWQLSNKGKLRCESIYNGIKSIKI